MTVEPLMSQTILTMSFLPFLDLNVSVVLQSMGGSKRRILIIRLSDYQNILICVQKINEGLKGLEQHEYRCISINYNVVEKLI